MKHVLRGTAWNRHLQRGQDIGQEGGKKLPDAVPQAAYPSEILLARQWFDSGANHLPGHRCGYSPELRSRHLCNEADKRPAHNDDGNAQKVSRQDAKPSSHESYQLPTMLPFDLTFGSQPGGALPLLFPKEKLESLKEKTLSVAGLHVLGSLPLLGPRGEQAQPGRQRSWRELCKSLLNGNSRSISRARPHPSASRVRSKSKKTPSVTNSTPIPHRPQTANKASGFWLNISD